MKDANPMSHIPVTELVASAWVLPSGPRSR